MLVILDRKVNCMLENLFKKYKLVLLYLFFGGVTTVVNILIFYITFQILNLSTFTSTILSWLAALIIAFITNKQFVFQSVSWNNKIIFKEFMLFFSYRSLTGLLDLIITLIGIDIFNFNSLVVKITANIVVILTNYFASKLVIFKNKN